MSTSLIVCYSGCFLVFPFAASHVIADNIHHGLRVPPGFEVTEYADGKLANDIYCMTVDPQGRVIVSGRGYIRILIEDDGTGKATRAIEIADGPKDGAMGLLWEGKSLYVTGDGGLRRYRDVSDDGRSDGPSELIRAMKTGGEHDAHAIRRGPDGWLYLLCGNNAKIDHSFAQAATSPIREPVAGCVLRFSPDLKTSEIVADGFRNPYGFDFNTDGELFTFDSDNERCVSLPWYEPIRFYHVVPGGHHGWLSPQHAQFWRLPPTACDIVPPVLNLGRGSPTGVVCYRHVQFPDHYQGGMFLCDWTFGRVYFLRLKGAGASYSATSEVFLESVGENGFAPTAIAVHPVTGDLFISIGGRGTRGAVYRIRYPKILGSIKPEAPAALQVKPRSLEFEESQVRGWMEKARSEDAAERLHALQAILRHRQRLQSADLLAVIHANWGHNDRLLRKATADLIGCVDRKAHSALQQAAKTNRQRLTLALGLVESVPADSIQLAVEVLKSSNCTAEEKLDSVRVLQLLLGDVVAASLKGTAWEGYSARGTGKITEAVPILRLLFPQGDDDVDREISRTLALIEDDDAGILHRVMAQITEESSPVTDIHYLLVLGRLKADRTESDTHRIAQALLRLDSKITSRKLNRDTNWPLRVAELHAELARKDPRLNGALLAAEEFGRPDHALFAQAPGFDRRRAAEIFVARAERDKDYAWTTGQVSLLGSLPEEKALPLLRQLFDRGGFEDAVLPILARQPKDADRGRYIAGSNSPQLAQVRICVDAFAALPPRRDGKELLALVRALRSLSEAKEEKALRDRIALLLQQITAEKNLGSGRDAWTAWFAKAYPDLAAKLGGPDGVDVAGWTKRLADIDLAKADAGRGKQIFSKASCAACHSGAQALGPDLRGVTGRFSRDDLFTAIIQPSKDISPRYRTTMIETSDGKVYQGMIIYEAVDSLLLQTGPATTVRLVNKQISSRRFTDTSLMPVGLLDKLTDQEIADLYGYLKELGTRKD
jgi:putative heme-binding domain-containing protein